MKRASSNEPDDGVLAFLDRVDALALWIVATVVVLDISLWLIPPLRGLAPPIWSKMTFNSALGMGLSTLSLTCSGEQRLRWALLVSRTAGILVLCLGALTLAEYLSSHSWGLDTWAPHLEEGRYPGRPSPQTASGLVLAGLSLLLIRQYKNLRSLLADIFALCFLALFLILLSGYLYGALEVVGLDPHTFTAPQTLLCLGALALVVAARRARCGALLAVLVNVGIGSQIVRFVLPFALLIPFAFVATVAYLINFHIVPPPYARAFAAAGESFVILCFTVWMAWRINGLERQLRDLSLTDELTRINNRRGFYLLANQSFRDVVRAESGITVFFFDMDGLKRANDSAGHDAGSMMLQSLAAILVQTFRGSDIVGRVGGDEFAVVTIDKLGQAPHIIELLERRVAEFNLSADPRCRLGFSVGFAESDGGTKTSFDQLITEADQRMYRQKMTKRTSRTATPTEPSRLMASAHS